jgi:prolyl-tRNA editing enzyme YbaK/EbsC (Cys-tRNA(Pro) deacylase)
MARLQPPATLEALRDLLDHASARRSFLTGLASNSGERPRPAPYGTRVRVVIADVDGDYVATILTDGDRLDTATLAETLGGKRAQLVSPQTVRHWLRTSSRLEDEARSDPLAWDEVPLITLLPTVLDRGLLDRDFLLGGTGDPECMLRIAPGELRRVTVAVVAPIRRPGRTKAAAASSA